MTAINVIRQAASVHIISDGAFCDDQGIVAEIGPNAFALPHLPAAIAINGSTHFMPFLVHRLSRECRSFDDLLGRVARTAFDVHVSFPTMFGTFGFGKLEPDFDLVVAGWSVANGQPKSFILSTHDRTITGGRRVRAWELSELPDVLIAPPVDDAQVQATGWRLPPSADRFRPHEDGLALLEAQRLTRKESRDQQGKPSYVHVVGGFVQLTSITPSRINSSILRWWPDLPGLKIDPKDDSNQQTKISGRST